MRTPSLSRDSLIFTPHAAGRTLDMAVDPLEVQNCLFSPDVVTWSEKHQGWNFIAGRLCCGVSPEGERFVVTTVLWRDRENWRRDLERGTYGGRELREAV